VARANRVAAEAKVNEARAGVHRAEAEIARSRSELERTRRLVEEGAVTAALEDEMRAALAAAEAVRQEIDAQVRSAEAGLVQADALVEKATSDLDAARSRVQVARADLERVNVLIGFTRITAPFAGVVTARNVHPGYLAQAGGDGPALVTVSCTDRLRVVAAVPEVEAAFVEVGDPVEIRLQSLPGEVVKGSVARTAWSLAEATRTLRVEVDLDNAAASPATLARPAALRPGLYATTTIIADEHADAIVVPKTAVLRDKDGAACFVIVGDTVSRRKVATGLEEAGRVEIISGLAVDERIVATGVGSLADGQTVKVQ
jgi:RND family efflux transporter MFP subunit